MLQRYITLQRNIHAVTVTEWNHNPSYSFSLHIVLFPRCYLLCLMVISLHLTPIHFDMSALLSFSPFFLFSGPAITGILSWLWPKSCHYISMDAEVTRKLPLCPPKERLKSCDTSTAFSDAGCEWESKFDPYGHAHKVSTEQEPWDCISFFALYRRQFPKVLRRDFMAKPLYTTVTTVVSAGHRERRLRQACHH